MFFLHLDLPYRYEPRPRSAAETECAQGGRTGCGRLLGRRVQPVGTVSRRALGGQSGTRSDAAGTWTEDWIGLGGSHASRADGLRVERLSRAEVAHGGRDAEYDGRDGEKYVVSPDAKTAQRAGGEAMSLDFGLSPCLSAKGDETQI